MWRDPKKEPLQPRLVWCASDGYYEQDPYQLVLLIHMVDFRSCVTLVQPRFRMVGETDEEIIRNRRLLDPFDPKSWILLRFDLAAEDFRLQPERIEPQHVLRYMEVELPDAQGLEAETLQMIEFGLSG